MRTTSKILLYVLILISVLQNWFWLALLLTLFFSLRCGAGSLIMMAILIDGYFGNFYSIPYLSLMSVVWYVVVSHFRYKIVKFNLS